MDGDQIGISTGLAGREAGSYSPRAPTLSGQASQLSELDAAGKGGPQREEEPLLAQSSKLGGADVAASGVEMTSKASNGSGAGRSVEPGLERAGRGGDLEPLAIDGVTGAAAAGGATWRASATEQGAGSVAVGRVLLLLVAMLWGAYGVEVKYIYMQPGPPLPSILTLVRKVLAVLFALLLLPLESKLAGSAASQRLDVGEEVEKEEEEDKEEEKTPLGKSGPGGQHTEPPVSPPGGWNGGGPKEDHNRAAAAAAGRAAGLGAAGSAAGRRSGGWTGVWPRAVELGMWTFLGTALQAQGLEMTTATRAGFEIQLTSILVPLLSVLGGESVPAATWAATALALAGVLLLGAPHPAAGGGGDAAAPTPPPSVAGDALVLAATVFYALGTVRLGAHARAVPPARLTTGVMAVAAALAAAWAAGDLARVARDGGDLSSVWEGWRDPGVMAAVLASAVGSGTVAGLFQIVGQSAVSPAEAQVLFSSTPLWSALFAALLLGERLEWSDWRGGAVLLVATLLAAAPRRPRR